MAIKVTIRATNEGLRYSISGLTFDQAFRIKHAKAKTISQRQEVYADFNLGY